MSLVEQAAKRLEQLRRAGVELPEEAPLAEPTIRRAPALAPRNGAGAEAASIAPPSIAPERRKTAALKPKRVKLDLQAISASGLLVPQASRSRLADEFRVIKRPLIANAMGRNNEPIANGNLIMVTSAMPGEGKSFTAINLAISIAMELDNTVVLVDADVARPSVLNMLGMPPAPGLLDVVSKNSLDITGVLLRTNIEKLSILPSGTQHPRATELLASDAMTRLLDDMARRYDDRIIIFDSPPLLLTTEARELATHMGQIVIVVHAESTTQATVKQAVDTIAACPVKMMVLNQTRQTPSDAYGYGYGYGYGHEKE
ncbi:MAG: XrtA-associated tyrosine autokinase [Azonexus sp.]|nr:XrtA-associated tyrosine autokinase [Azonexus sp.]